MWLCLSDGSHKNIWTWKLKTAMHPSSDDPSVVSMKPDISCVFLCPLSSLSHFTVCVCVFGHGLVLVHWRWAVSCLLVSTHMVWITHLLLVTSLDYFIRKRQAVSLCCMNREAQRQHLLSLALLGQNVSIALWDVPAKSQWLIPDTSFELQAWYRHMQLLGSESKEKKEGERITKHELLETGINYTQWFIGHDRSKRGMEVHHGKSSSSLIVERSVIEWESPQFAFQVKGHPAFYLKSDTGG